MNHGSLSIYYNILYKDSVTKSIAVVYVTESIEIVRSDKKENGSPQKENEKHENTDRV